MFRFTALWKDEQLPLKILETAKTKPSLSITRIRELISSIEGYAERIDTISDRTIYRFLAANRLSWKDRMKLLRQKVSTADNLQRYENDVPIPAGAGEVPKDVLKRYRQRVSIARIMLDDNLDPHTKRHNRNRYCSKHYVTETTVRHYATRYKNGGPEALFFFQRKFEKQPRIHNSRLASKVLETAEKHPSFSIRRIRKLITEIDRYRKSIDRISDRTIHRFLNENGLSKRERMKMCGFISPELVKKGDYSSLQQMLKIMQCNLEYEYASPTTRENLTTDEFHELVACIRDRQLCYRNRAVVIIANYEGVPTGMIAKCLFISSRTVWNHVHQFHSDEIKDFLSNERKFPKKWEMKEYIDAVFSIIHSPPSSYGINRTSWIMPDVHRIMASKGLKIGLSNIRQIIRNAGFKVRRAKEVLTSNDPGYEAKLKEITGILSNLKPSEKFFSIDEYGPFAIKIHNGRKLVPKGEIRTIPQYQRTKGSLIITAALELSTNQITHFYSKKKNSEEMIKLLRILLKKHPDEEFIYFSWDAASWHASKKFHGVVNEVNSTEYRTKNKSPFVRLVPLPAKAQFLNVIESVFSGLARAIIHNSDYQSVSECKSAIDQYFVERNQNFLENPKRAGDKIWGKERVVPKFSESNNCKDPKYR